MNAGNMMHQYEKLSKPNSGESSHQHLETQVAQKRKRVKSSSNQQAQVKRRQPKSLFRPWCEEQQITAADEVKTTSSPKTSPTQTAVASVLPILYQANLPYGSHAPQLMPAYQLALQQQSQTAIAMQQAAIYQRQLILAHVLAQQHQQYQQQHHLYQQHQMQMHQQHLCHKQQKQQQQLFDLASQQGYK